MMSGDENQVDSPTSIEDFEDFVDALLKVDPKGLSGKHRRSSLDDEHPPVTLDRQEDP